MRPDYDYQLTANKLQESICERDLGVHILHYIRRVVNEINHILINVKITFKYIDKEY